MSARARKAFSMDCNPNEDLTAEFSEVRLALVTPARNEARFIEMTIRSVIAQTIRPVKWIIVSDGSTDGTDDIVRKYASEHPWIELLQLPERRERHFAGKVHAFNAAYSRLSSLEYDVIGNLDADITFDEEYFAFLLGKFARNPRLGVAGTPFQDESLRYDYRFVSTEHVSGCCQFFRQKCYKEIGGYRPIKTGGVDLFAVISARMKGWQTRSFLEKSCIHHREIGTAASYSGVIGAFRDGRRDYSFGCDPLWQLSRCIYRLFLRRPFVFGGSLCFAGFLWAMVTRAEIIVPPDFVQFRRAEERRRLRELLKQLLPCRSLQTPDSLD
jgi:glycosyltransferase involved in cell wall biosynthesis